MKRNHLKKMSLFLFAALVTTIYSCQNMDRPELGDYPKDANAPGGPLKFYTPFDGTTSNPLMNAVDQIRANFPSNNPYTQIDGVEGKAVEGVNGTFINYAKPNDFGATAKSFTISFWEKHNGDTKNNTGTNGPEFPLSLTSSNGHWSGSTAMLLIEGTNAAAAVKFPIVDKNMADTWFVWEGANSVPGLLDNQWHHCAFVYDAATSGLTFYKDGMVISTKYWTGHGDINLDNEKITALRIGSGPGNNPSTDDWLSSNWKGGLDQFRMYNTVLSATEVNTLFTQHQ